METKSPTTSSTDTPFNLITKGANTITSPCNGSAKRVPGGVVCTGGLESEGVQVIWYRRYTI